MNNINNNGTGAFMPGREIARTPQNKEYNCKSCAEPDEVCDMVQCDSCDDWHHYQCVGVSPGISNRNWRCPNCIGRNVPTVVRNTNQTASADIGRTSSTQYCSEPRQLNVEFNTIVSDDSVHNANIDTANTNNDLSESNVAGKLLRDEMENLRLGRKQKQVEAYNKRKTIINQARGRDVKSTRVLERHLNGDSNTPLGTRELFVPSTSTTPAINVASTPWSAPNQQQNLPGSGAADARIFSTNTSPTMNFPTATPFLFPAAHNNSLVSGATSKSTAGLLPPVTPKPSDYIQPPSLGHRYQPLREIYESDTVTAPRHKPFGSSAMSTSTATTQPSDLLKPSDCLRPPCSTNSSHSLSADNIPQCSLYQRYGVSAPMTPADTFATVTTSRTTTGKQLLGFTEPKDRSYLNSSGDRSNLPRSLHNSNATAAPPRPSGLLDYSAKSTSTAGNQPPNLLQQSNRFHSVDHSHQHRLPLSLRRDQHALAPQAINTYNTEAALIRSYEIPGSNERPWPVFPTDCFQPTRSLHSVRDIPVPMHGITDYQANLPSNQSTHHKATEAHISVTRRDPPLAASYSNTSTSANKFVYDRAYNHTEMYQNRPTIPEIELIYSRAGEYAPAVTSSEIYRQSTLPTTTRRCPSSQENPIASSIQPSREIVEPSVSPNRLNQHSRYPRGPRQRQTRENPNNSSSESEDEPELTARQLAARKLFSKDLPKFSGKASDWPLFISEYKRSTKKCGFSNDENLRRLQRCLEGEALKKVQKQLRFPQMVPRIIETLKSAFGKPYLIIHDLIEEIRAYPPLRMDKLDKVIEFADDVQNLTATMEEANLTKHLENPMLWVELAEKLPLTLGYEWAKHRSDFDDEEVDLSMFSEWISNIVRTLDRMNSISQMPKTERKRENKTSKAFVNTHLESSLGDQNPDKQEQKCQICDQRDQTTNKPERKCRICDQSCPNFKSCETFKTFTPKQRREVARQYRICFNCVRYHRGRRCFKYGVCGVNGCSERHDPMLHEMVTTSEISTPETVATQVLVQKNPSMSVMFRIIPVELHGEKKSVKTFAFLDEGSSVTLLDDDLAKQLGLTGEKAPLCIKWTGGTRKYLDSSVKVSMKIRGLGGKQQLYDINDARTVHSLDLPQQTMSQSFLDRYKHLNGLPIATYKNAVAQILIGIDNWRFGIPLRCIEGLDKEPIATKTRLGWCVSGPCDSSALKDQPTYSFHVCECQSSDETLHQLVKSYFSVESLGVTPTKDPVMSGEDKRAVEILESTTVRRGNFFETGLLWRFDSMSLPDSYNMAYKRWECLNRKMARQPSLSENLHRQIKEYVAKGYARKLSHSELQTDRAWYLPIFAVENANKPGKTRLVWDAAAETRGVSLNSLLLKGPDLMNSLIGVLLRFRERNVGICADIKEMFHQIRIRPLDQHVQRFMWGEDESKNPQIYVMRVMTFGAACSPCSAQFVMTKNADEFKNNFPAAVKAIKQNHYVDDLLVSVDSLDEGLKLAQDIRYVHAQGGFEIRNWISNHKSIVDAMGGSKDDQKSLTLGQENEFEKILGMWWCPNIDAFTYKLSQNPKFTTILDPRHKPTKRDVLKIVMMIFDPLGLMSHFLTYPKVLLQNMWRREMEWDDKLGDDLLSKWRVWADLLPSMESVRIPRCYMMDSRNLLDCDVQLHTFVDASEQASAAVSYLRFEHSPEAVMVALVSAKTRVAPLKTLTIPRLELEAAVLGSRLAKTIRENLTFAISSQTFWSDSKTVLCWLKSDRIRYRQFVSFRVFEILEHSNSTEWRFVPTKDNVADEGTKWTKPIQLNSENRWFKGPTFLYKGCKLWPNDIDHKLNTTEEDLRPMYHHTILDAEKFIPVRRVAATI